jgi:hypothetical protein
MGAFAMGVEFSNEETAALIQLLVGTIERHLFPESPDIQRLRNILGKIRPIPELQNDAAEIEDDDTTDTWALDPEVATTAEGGVFIAALRSRLNRHP